MNVHDIIFTHFDYNIIYGLNGNIYQLICQWLCVDSDQKRQKLNLFFQIFYGFFLSSLFSVAIIFILVFMTNVLTYLLGGEQNLCAFILVSLSLSLSLIFFPFHLLFTCDAEEKMFSDFLFTFWERKPFIITLNEYVAMECHNVDDK